MRVVFTPRAQARAKSARATWRSRAEHAPDLFDDELAVLVYRLKTIPQFGTPYPTARRPHLKRSLLEGTQYHVYFERDERKQEIRVLMIWHARRGRTPKL